MSVSSFFDRVTPPPDINKPPSSINMNTSFTPSNINNTPQMIPESNVSETIGINNDSINQHISLIFIPIVIYGLTFLYGHFTGGPFNTKFYSILSYLSFCIFLIGYSRYCIYKTNQSTGVFYISIFLIITSSIAILYSLYNILFTNNKNETETLEKIPSDSDGDDTGGDNPGGDDPGGDNPGGDDYGNEDDEDETDD